MCNLSLKQHFKWKVQATADTAEKLIAAFDIILQDHKDHNDFYVGEIDDEENSMI